MQEEKRRLRTRDGRTLTYEVAGEGPLLVCLPGGPGFSSRYFSEVADLDLDFTVVLLDPRGTGGSEPARHHDDYGINAYADDVEDLRRHLGVERLDVLGHSHGGSVALAWAAAHPAHAGRLVVANALARFHPEQMDVAARAIESHAHEAWYQNAFAALELEQSGRYRDAEEQSAFIVRQLPFYFASYGEAERDWVASLEGERVNVDAYRQFNQEGLMALDLRPALGRIRARTLVLAGEADIVTGPAAAKEIAAGILGARLVVIPNCGHMSFVEQPGLFRELVTRFLRAR